MKNLKKQIKKYIRGQAYLEDPITLEGFCAENNISVLELNKLVLTEEDHKAIERLITASKADIMEKSLKGTYNASAAKLILSNLGMNEKSEIDNKIEISFEGARL